MKRVSSSRNLLSTASTLYQDAVSRVLLDSPSTPHDLELQSVAGECDRLTTRLAIDASYLAQKLQAYAKTLSRGGIPQVPVTHALLEANDATLRARLDELLRLARVTGGKERVRALRNVLEPEELPSTCPVTS